MLQKAWDKTEYLTARLHWLNAAQNFFKELGLGIQHLFEKEIVICNIINVFAGTFDQCNAS